MALVTRRGRPPVVLVGVLVAHGLLLAALLRETRQRAAEPDVAVGWLVLLDEPVRTAPEPVVAEDSVATGSPTPPGAPAPSAASSTTALPVTAAPAAAQAAPRGWVDWLRSGEIVARDTAERAAEAERKPRPPFRQGLPPTPSRAIVLTPERRRTGTSETLADGESIFWINENCYVTTGSDSLTQRELHAAHRNMTRCVIRLGKRQPRGDLFYDLPNHKKSRHVGDDVPPQPDTRGPDAAPTQAPPVPEAAGGDRR